MNRAREQHFPLVRAQRAEIRAVDLIIDVLRAVQILNHAAAADNQRDQFLNRFVAEQPLQVQHRDSVMAAEHVHRADVFSPEFLRPAHQPRAVMVLNRVNHQPRQEKVVGHIALSSDLFIGSRRIRVMDLRQKGQAMRIGRLANAFQRVPRVRLVHKIAQPRRFGRIGKRIQPHNRRAVFGQLAQHAVIIRPDPLAFQVQIHLAEVFPPRFQQLNACLAAAFKAREIHLLRLLSGLQPRVKPRGQNRRLAILHIRNAHQILRIDRVIADLLIERVPIRHIAPIRQANHQNRQPRLAEEHATNVFFFRLDVSGVGHFAASRPELIPIHEKIAIRRCVAVF